MKEKQLLSKETYKNLLEENEKYKEQNEFLMKRDNQAQILEQKEKFLMKLIEEEIEECDPHFMNEYYEGYTDALKKVLEIMGGEKNE